MKRVFAWLRIIVPLLIILGGIGGVTLWLGLPRVAEVSPPDGAVDTPAGSALRIRFTRVMRPAEVQARLSIEPQIAGDYAWDGNTLVFAPKAPWPAGANVQVSLAPGARPQAFPPLPMTAAHTWRFTIRQPRLAYLYPSDGPANITVRNPVTGEDETLTDAPAGISDFTLSADGHWVFYSAENPQGGSDLYRMDISRRFNPPAGEDVPPSPPQAELLVACAPATCQNVAVSPDSRYLAYERSEPPAPGQQAQTQIWVMALTIRPDAALSSVDAPGGPPRPIGDPSHAASFPSWSADTRLSYFDSQDQAFIVVTPDGEQQQRFRNTTGQPGDWQPGGPSFVAPEIYFLDANFSPALQNQLGRLSDSHLMLYEQSGSGRDLTEVEGIEDALPAFSPDGRVLAFARKYLNIERWSPGRQLWLIDVVTRQGRALTDEPDYNHFDFAWSPDGRQLAYVRFNQSQLIDPPEVWVIDVESGEQTKILAGGFSPQWIP